MKQYEKELLEKAYKVAEKGEYYEYDKVMLINRVSELLDKRIIDQELAIQIDEIASLNTFC